MKRRTVIIAPSVQDLITEQVLYIAEDSLDNALSWEARLAEAVKGLGDIATFAVDEEASARLGYTILKYVFEGTYLIHYFLDDDAGIVRVVGFRHGSRLPKLQEP